MEYEGRGRDLKRSDGVCSFFFKNLTKKNLPCYWKVLYERKINNIYSRDGLDILPILNEDARKLSEDR